MLDTDPKPSTDRKKTTKSKWQRWIPALVCALLLHAMVLGTIGYLRLPDYDITVEHMSPAPNARIELQQTQAVQVTIHFSRFPQNAQLDPEGAFLYQILDDGTRKPVATAFRHPDAPCALRFAPIKEAGKYEVILKSSGEHRIFAEPFSLDGEFDSAFPTGNGEKGGDFSATFEIVNTRKEIMTATMYDPQKPLVNDESPAASLPQQPQQDAPTPMPAPTPAPTPDKTHKPPKQIKTTEPQPQQTVETTPTPTPTQTKPSPVIAPEFLQVNPQTFNKLFGSDARAFAEDTFNEQDANKFIAGGKLSNRRLKQAYNPEGPVIGRGEMGNAVQNIASVSEYIAKMHDQIHIQWAYTFLIYLDTHPSMDPTLTHPNISAEVEITLDSYGKVLDVRFVHASGVTMYDSEAVNVAWHSSPGLPLPKEMRSVDGKAYVHWTFWRDTRQCGVFGVKVYTLDHGKQNTLFLNEKEIELEEKKLKLYEQNTYKKIQKQNQNYKPAFNTTTPEPPKRISPMDD